MELDQGQNDRGASTATGCGAPVAPTSQCIDWYAEGESRTVEVAGVRITVRFIGRKGRRGRICISAPSGAVFRSAESDEPSETIRSNGD